MKGFLWFLMSCMLLFSLTACVSVQEEEGANTLNYSGVKEKDNTTKLASETVTSKVLEENEVVKMDVQIGDSIFTATLAENSAADSFLEMIKSAPVVLQMSDYSGFEKVGVLGTNLLTRNSLHSQMTAQAGDIVLYNENQIVIFYGSNAWNYTKLGKIDDLSGWEEALGSGDVQVTFSLG